MRQNGKNELSGRPASAPPESRRMAQTALLICVIVLVVAAILSEIRDLTMRAEVVHDNVRNDVIKHEIPRQ